ncbi:MAG: hypothetical protein WCL16_14500 [bacterium]
MPQRENLIAALDLDGRHPERIPYTVNQEFVADDPARMSFVYYISGAFCLYP